jgi:uncharacterized membrane protein
MAFPSATEEQIKEGKSIAWLSYFGIFFLIPLLAHKDNPFSKYHARQGMVLFFLEIVLGILWGILGAIAAAIAFASYSASGIGGGLICGTILSIIMGLLWVVVGVFAIIGIIQSASGKFWKMPVIGGIAESWFKGMIPEA